MDTRFVITSFLGMFIGFSSVPARGDPQPVVMTPLGLIGGKYARFSKYDRAVEFLGVPYAKPPIGNLRLRPPQMIDASDELYNATNYKPACLHDVSHLEYFNMNDEFNSEVSEDCLYLNIYIPKVKMKNIPVMVYIHGGSFVAGSGSSYNGRALAVKGQVIVITLNYRLGLLGFLPTGGTESTLGLQDQILALKWVKMCISSFHGDPNQVTIFGSSAGGASTSLLSVSPKAKGLFNRVICQSGVGSSPWVPVTSETEEEFNEFKEGIKNEGCDLNVVECLRLGNDSWVRKLSETTIMNRVRADNDVVMADYFENTALVHDGLEFIMGTITDEAVMIVNHECIQITQRQCVRQDTIDFESFTDLQQLPLDMLPQSTNLIKHYNQWYEEPNVIPKPGYLTLNAATQLLTDVTMKVPTNDTAYRLSKAGFIVRVFEFNVASGLNPHSKIPWSSTGTQHGDELPYLFGLPTEGIKSRQANKLMKLWSRFARGRMTETMWPSFNTNRGEYLYIDEKHQMGQQRAPYFPNYKNKFWRKYLDTGEFGQ